MPPADDRRALPDRFRAGSRQAALTSAVARSIISFFMSRLTEREEDDAIDLFLRQGRMRAFHAR